MRQNLGWMRERFAEAQIALMTLSRLPAGRVADPVPNISAAAWAFPLVGVAVGGLSAIGYALAIAGHLPPAFAAVTAIAIGIVASGAIHEDGLADLADGLGGGSDTAKKLAIMRDSHVGSYGVLALVISLAMRSICIAALTEPFVVAWTFVALAVASRAAVVLVLYFMPAARADGLGRSASHVGWSRCAVAAVFGLAGLISLTTSWPFVTIAMVAAGVLMAWLAWRYIRGQTGDVLGAVQQFTEIAGWAAVVGWGA